MWCDDDDDDDDDVIVCAITLLYHYTVITKDGSYLASVPSPLQSCRYLEGDDAADEAGSRTDADANIATILDNTWKKAQAHALVSGTIATDGLGKGQGMGKGGADRADDRGDQYSCLDPAPRSNDSLFDRLVGRPSIGSKL